MHEVGGVETELLLTLNRRPVRILGEEATHGDTAEAHHTDSPSLPGVLEPDTHLWDRRPDS